MIVTRGAASRQSGWKTVLGLSLSLIGAISGLAQMTTAQAAPEPHLTMEILGTPDIEAPDTPPTQAVVLFSGIDGWDHRERGIAKTLAGQGAVVMGFDLRNVLRRMNAAHKDCLTVIGEIEAVSHQIQRHLGAPTYVFPTIAGIGEGGTMAMAIAAQTVAATISRVVVVDPHAALPSTQPLCSPAPRHKVDGGLVYDLPSGPEPFPMAISITTSAERRGEIRAHDLSATHHRISVLTSSKTPSAALLQALAQPIPPNSDSLADLPLVDLPATDSNDRYADTLAIFYSGDGGWRDLDKDLAAILRADGLAVVGVDCLRYFWNKKTPDQTARDLARIITAYQRRGSYQRIVLIGFSFGANVLPATYNRLPRQLKSSVVQISLLGKSDGADFEVTVSGWLNRKHDDALPIAPELAQIPGKLLQCFHGKDDDGTDCDTIENRGGDVILTEGGHHFDGDYEALARQVLHGLKRRGI